MPIGCPRAKGFNAQNRFTKRFGAPNLFANQFDVLYPVTCCYPISFKYEMVSSGNILEALCGGLALGWIDTVDIFHVLP